MITDDRICFWEGCELNFPNQTQLVDHIEKAHVNTYKGIAVHSLSNRVLSLHSNVTIFFINNLVVI